jgi:hypothetical protein
MNEIEFPIDINGYHFISWADSSRQLGYASSGAITNRYHSMKDTHSLEEIFTPKNMSFAEMLFPMDINGYHFVSWKDANDQLGYGFKKYPYGIYLRYSRMKDTHTLEEIFVPMKCLFPLDVNGYYLTSWINAAEQLGYSTWESLRGRYNRFRDECTLEEIFIPKDLTIQSHSKHINDDMFPLNTNGYYLISWEDAAKQLGYKNANSMKSKYYILKDNVPLEKIFTPKQNSDRSRDLFPIDINGYHFVSWRDACRQLGEKNAGVFMGKYYKNYPLMEVLERDEDGNPIVWRTIAFMRR